MKAFYFFIFFILIKFSKEECGENEINKNSNSCISIPKLLNDQTEELDQESIDYLSGTVKSISKMNYNR